MRNKIFKSVCLLVVLTVSGYSLSFAEGKISKDKEIETLKKELDKATKEADAANKRLAPLKEENDKLKADQASIYEAMGTAYTKAKMFEEAIDAYTKSLTYAPNNGQVHYYLGLLYQKARKNNEKAVLHLKRYLYLNPDAKNKDEVNYLIEMILNQR